MRGEELGTSSGNGLKPAARERCVIGVRGDKGPRGDNGPGRWFAAVVWVWGVGEWVVMVVVRKGDKGMDIEAECQKERKREGGSGGRRGRR